MTPFIRIVSLCLSLALSMGLSAQEVNFYAEADARQIVVGNYFEVSFVLENAQGEYFQPPEFEPFELLSGPSRSTQMSIINGRRSQKMTFSYGLTINEAGKHTLGSATVTVNGKTYKTDPISIEALQGSRPTAQGATSQGQGADDTGEFIIEAELSQDTGYIGQQITLRYVLYTTQDVRSYNFLNTPNFDGFYAQEIQNYRGRPERVVKDGVQYVRRVIKVIALFPQQKGTFELSPANVNLGVATRRSSSSFFFNSNLKPVRLASNAVELYITDLPRGAPASFAGAVGDFFMGSAIDKQSITKDDAVTLTYQIKGDGDGKMLKAPDQPYSDLFDIYDPNLLAEESKVVGDRIETTKTYEYLLLPKKEGKLSFRPELSYYNVDSNKYETIQGQLYTINVAPSTGRQTADLADREVTLPPPATSTKLRSRDSFFFQSVPYWIANGALGLGLIGLLVAKQVKTKQDSIDPSIKKHNKAKKLAIAKLATAKSAWTAGDTKEFYIQLRKGLLEYLSSKTYQDSAQMSKDDIKALLSENGLSDLEFDIMDIMTKGEMAIYANMSSGTEGEIYDKALNLIEKIESTLKK